MSNRLSNLYQSASRTVSLPAEMPSSKGSKNTGSIRHVAAFISTKTDA